MTSDNETLVEHSELSGHIDIVEQCRDWIAAEAAMGGSGGRLDDFAASLRIVIDQFDKQRRSRNWYEVAYTAGKQKLIDHAVDRAVERIATLLLSGDLARECGVDLTNPSCPIGIALTQAAMAVRASLSKPFEPMPPDRSLP